MSTEQQARALMMRHHQMIRNRQQCMLSRAAAEVGMTAVDYKGHIQGKLPGTFATDYDHSNAALS